MEHIVDMNIQDDFIVISLNEEKIKDRNFIFTYVKEYFDELKHLERFIDDLSILKSSKESQKLITNKPY